MRKAEVYYRGIPAGLLEEVEQGYRFQYYPAYLARPDAEPVSLTLPLREEPWASPTLFPFFDGLIPEGWLLEVSVRVWKMNPRDRMGLLLSCCRDCIGAVSVRPAGGDGDE